MGPQGPCVSSAGWSFNSAFIRFFCCSIRLASSEACSMWWSRWIPWLFLLEKCRLLDSIWYIMWNSCWYIKPSLVHCVIVLTEALWVRKVDPPCYMDNSRQDESLLFLGWKGSNAINVPPNGWLVSSKEGSMWEVHCWFPLLAGWVFKSSSKWITVGECEPVWLGPTPVIMAALFIACCPSPEAAAKEGWLTSLQPGQLVPLLCWMISVSVNLWQKDPTFCYYLYTFFISVI